MIAPPGADTLFVPIVAIAPLLMYGGMALASYLGKKLGGGGKDKQKDDDELNTTLDPYRTALQGSADRLSDEGQQLTSSGTQGMEKVMAYLQKLASGDASSVMDATKASRGRVIDQYDSAKRSISNFTPRGGGSAAAMGDLETSKANQLSDILSSKQDEAVGQLSAASQAMTGLGLSAEQLASQDLNSIINTILTQKGFKVAERGQNMEAIGGVGGALGTLLGLILTRNQGKAA